MTIKIGFGGAALSSIGGGYGFGPVSEKEACSLLSCLLEHDISTFDLAPVYGFGQAEKTIGNYLFKKGNREKVVIYTKGGITWNDQKRIFLSNDPKVITEMFEDSLRRLKTEYIDTYFVHWPDPKIDIRYPLEVLQVFKEQGKIKKIGLSNPSSEDIEKSTQVCELTHLQDEWNLFNKHKKERYQNWISSGFTFSSWGTLDKGILCHDRLKSNRIPSREYHKTDARKFAPWWKKHKKKEKFELLYKIQQEVIPPEKSLFDFYLQWLNQENLNSLHFVGCKSTDQLLNFLSRLNSFDEKTSSLNEKINHYLKDFSL